MVTGKLDFQIPSEMLLQTFAATALQVGSVSAPPLALHSHDFSNHVVATRILASVKSTEYCVISGGGGGSGCAHDMVQ